jgi:methionyl-tRNA formyltransferase
VTARAVVFAYHNVGVRCLSVLLAHGVNVPLVVTHQDDPNERVWFESVAALTRLYDIPTVTPEAAALPELAERVAALAPDFIFSFYYRHMLPTAILANATRGALNIHGSLLPRYRGRAPVNWAVLNGESETGASLHYMAAKPDAGDLVAQQSVPILPNDTARLVFDKVTYAAESCLNGILPTVLNGTAPRRPLDLAQGSYRGRRRPEDGRIDWRRPAWEIHNLVRAVAPPYPGAFSRLGEAELRLLQSHFTNEPARETNAAPALYCDGGGCYVDCADGKRFRLLRAELDGEPVTPAELKSRYGTKPVYLGDQACGKS